MAAEHFTLFCQLISWATILVLTADVQQVFNHQSGSIWCTIIGSGINDTQISRNHAKNHKDCHLSCGADPACESTNYIPSKRLCEMNAASHSDCPRSFVQRNDAIYTPKFKTDCRHCVPAYSNFGESSHLEAHYAFEGNLLDSTSAGRNGLASGEVFYPRGVCGRAASFNGHSKIDVDAFRQFALGSRFSVSAWFKRTNPDGYQGIVNAGYSEDGSWEVRMTDSAGGTGIGGTVITSHYEKVWPYNVVKVSLNDWHHVIMTYNGSQLLFYVDNELQTGTSDCCTGEILSKDIPVTIGQAGRGHAMEYFFGFIDEVKIFTTTLCPEEVDKMFRFPCTC
ncbi:uncharacterized protein LOC119729357 [Patiria miniata]|uniref:Apple domain-containing protein n=1 Tax=Patiria miniata TaxID=46514 RepID=A0A914A2M9_PATMI|nr:uncharacterized protein LOC119729357 [Patiria miniata]